MKYSVKDLRSDFPDDEACLRWLVEYLYPDGVFCVQCDRVTEHRPIQGRKVYACIKCRWQVSPMKGTIFEGTKVPLTDWFHAIYLMSTTKAGTSAAELERQLDVSYPTAFRMMHQIRTLMAAPEGKLSGEVEIDETFIHPNPFKRSSARRVYGMDARRKGEVVFGMVQRGGVAKLWHVKTAGARIILPLIEQHVRFGTLIHTDGYQAYHTLAKRGYRHRKTNHSIGEYFTADSSTQNIENVWSHFKRGIKGVYRGISTRYIQAYADEYAWRYSNRHRASMFWALMCRIGHL